MQYVFPRLYILAKKLVPNESINHHAPSDIAGARRSPICCDHVTRVRFSRSLLSVLEVWIPLVRINVLSYTCCFLVIC